jgi:C1A family cysteine protease
LYCENTEKKYIALDAGCRNAPEALCSFHTSRAFLIYKKMKNVKRSTFIDLSKGDKHALCVILWDDTFTKNRIAFGYSFSKILMN